MEMYNPGMREIIDAVGLLHTGDRQAARAELFRLWQKWHERDAPLERCTLAHFLADSEDEPAKELEWDLRALEAATGSREDSDRAAVDPSLATFLPSLHLNVADAYRRMGLPDLAKRHAGHGLAHCGSLGDDGYGQNVRVGLERLCRRLDDALERPENG